MEKKATIMTFIPAILLILLFLLSKIGIITDEFITSLIQLISIIIALLIPFITKESEERKELHTANHIINLLIYEIGIENVYKILKLSPKPIENGYLFEGSLYILSVSSSTLSNKIYIFKGRDIGVPTFDFDSPNENEMVFNEFIENFKKNCKESKIKLST